MILIMYTKRNLYTLLHSMNGGFLFSSQTRAEFSLTFTFQVYGANKDILTTLPVHEGHFQDVS